MTRNTKYLTMAIAAVSLMVLMALPSVASAASPFVYTTRIVPVKTSKVNWDGRTCYPNVYAKVEYYRGGTWRRMPNVSHIDNAYWGYCDNCRTTTRVYATATSRLTSLAEVSGNSGETRTCGRFSKCPKGHYFQKVWINSSFHAYPGDYYYRASSVRLGTWTTGR